MAVFTALMLFMVAQAQPPVAQADAKSLELYNAANWKELMTYGKQQLENGVDFPLLRMRTGYAAYMLGNYSESLRQYKKVYDSDAENSTALYYVYLNHVYLNNRSAARYYVGLLPEEKRGDLEITDTKLSSFDAEYSSKFTGDTVRRPANYLRASVGAQLGYKLELTAGVASYGQKIFEPILRTAYGRPNITVNQKEFYVKAMFTPKGNLSLVGSYHLLNTRFNNVGTLNHIGSAGVNIVFPSTHIGLGVSIGQLASKRFKQFDGTFTWYPFGNTKFYTISRAAYADSSMVFTQIAGLGLGKKVWLEGSVTLGQYYSLVEKNGLYVYNDIDKKLFKAGGGVYALLSPKLMLNVNYAFEQKQRYIFTNYQFYQHTINTALSWKF